MKHAKILDCTLRDGAYLVEKEFGEKTIKGIIRGLINAGIEWIELGFLQDTGFGKGKTVFKNGIDAKAYIPERKGHSEFAVLADYSRYSIENLNYCTGDSFRAVRACFFKQERYDVIDFCQAIKEKGYLLFVQPVDILGYSDMELIELIQMVNKLEPYCFSIVDTFGSMYMEDLQRLYHIIDHNLVKSSRIGFHSHNNMQMSSALAQEFLRITFGKRQIIIDTTISGMGRGAGNTPTELVAQYMVDKLGYGYHMDSILDIIDGYMDNIRSRCKWGYDTSYFIAGTYSTHVNNISYLRKKNSIRSKDIRYLLNKLGPEARKHYDYELLEDTYLEYLKSDINDEETIGHLKDEFKGRNILLIAPGKSAGREVGKINKYISDLNTSVITINFIHTQLNVDYVYFSNMKRYDYWHNEAVDLSVKKIVTSNIAKINKDNEKVVSIVRLIKPGWEHSDNSTLMLLRLLDEFQVESIGIAGFDGYDYMDNTENYFFPEMEVSSQKEDPKSLNEEISSMLTDYLRNRKGTAPIRFVTESRFSHCLEQ